MDSRSNAIVENEFLPAIPMQLSGKFNCCECSFKLSNRLIETGSPETLQQPKSLQSLAQIWCALHAHLPTLPRNLPMDRKVWYSIIANWQRSWGSGKYLNHQLRLCLTCKDINTHATTLFIVLTHRLSYVYFPFFSHNQQSFFFVHNEFLRN